MSKDDSTGKIQWDRLIKKLSPYTVQKGLRYLKHYGLKEFWIRLHERFEPEEVPYGPWYEAYRPDEETLEKQRKRKFPDGPLISIVVPAYLTPERFLRQMLDSLLAQTYENWELCLANGSPEDPDMQTVLKSYAEMDRRIRYQDLKENLGIAENTNAAFAMAKGDFIALLDHDDLLAPNALYEIAAALEEHPEADVIYTDEDKVTTDLSEHFQPHLKPDFNPDLLRSNNYICHFLVVKKTMLEKVGDFNPCYDGAQDYELVLRLTEQTDAIYHIRKILYHWRIHSGSTAGSSLSKDYAYDAGKRALEAYVQRRKIPAEIKEAQGHNSYEVIYEQEVPEPELINLAEIKEKDALNELVENSTREYLFIYDSRRTRLLGERERKELAQYACLNKVGLTGVRFKKHRKLVSAGIGVLPDGKKGYLFEKLPVCFKGYFNRAVLPQNVSAVPLEQCIIKKEAYLKAGGIALDKEPLERAIDFAGRLQKAGYQIMLDAKLTAVYKG